MPLILTDKQMMAISTVLTMADEYLADREDIVDGPNGEQRPNAAMQLRREILEVEDMLDRAMNSEA